jgi:hypothetical protein
VCRAAWQYLEEREQVFETELRAGAETRWAGLQATVSAATSGINTPNVQGIVAKKREFVLLAAANQCPKLIPVAALLALQDALMHFVNRIVEFFEHRLESGLTT